MARIPTEGKGIRKFKGNVNTSKQGMKGRRERGGGGGGGEKTLVGGVAVAAVQVAVLQQHSSGLELSQ